MSLKYDPASEPLHISGLNPQICTQGYDRRGELRAICGGGRFLTSTLVEIGQNSVLLCEYLPAVDFLWGRTLAKKNGLMYIIYIHIYIYIYIYRYICIFLSLYIYRQCIDTRSEGKTTRDSRRKQVPSASERSGINLQGFKDFYLNSQARIWPCHIRSAAVHGVGPQELFCKATRSGTEYRTRACCKGNLLLFFINLQPQVINY